MVARAPSAGTVVQRANSANAAGAPSGTSAPRPPAGALRRRTSTQSRKGNSNVMNFYTDDSPGMKIPPVMVLVASAIFILLVTMLHVIGKITHKDDA